jgi:2'-5' RNA ligase
MNPSLRLFIAVYPPPAVVSLLHACVASMTLPEHKPVTPEQVHITLLFLGDRRAKSLAEIEGSIESSCKGVRACIVRPRRLVTLPLPQKGPARLIAAETDAPPPLLELQKRLANRLASRERRGATFLPHLTLARFAGAGAEVGVRVEEPIASPEHVQFEVRSVCLVKSTLHPLGARHEVVREFGLA